MVDILIDDAGRDVWFSAKTDKGVKWILENLDPHWDQEPFPTPTNDAITIARAMRADGLMVSPAGPKVVDSHMTPAQEEELIRNGVIAPPGKRSAVQPRQPQADPETAADLKTDPWGMLTDALGDQQPDTGQPTPRRPMRHTIEPEIPGGPYHMTGASKTTGTILGDNNMEKKSSRELLRGKIAAMDEAKKARAFGRLREVAEKEPKKAGDALGELAHSLAIMANSISILRGNLDLDDVPKAASLKARMAVRKKYAAEFRRIAVEAPEQLADALVEFYNSLDEVAAGVENLAANLGIELGGPEGEFAQEGEAGLEEVGEALESPEKQAEEEAGGTEGTPEDKEEDVALAVGKQADSAGFVTDRDQSAEPKPVEKAEIPVSQGEAAIKASAKKPVGQK